MLGEGPLSFCISNELPADTHVAGPETPKLSSKALEGVFPDKNLKLPPPVVCQNLQRCCSVSFYDHKWQKSLYMILTDLYFAGMAPHLKQLVNMGNTIGNAKQKGSHFF